MGDHKGYSMATAFINSLKLQLAPPDLKGLHKLSLQLRLSTLDVQRLVQTHYSYTKAYTNSLQLYLSPPDLQRLVQAHYSYSYPHWTCKGLYKTDHQHFILDRGGPVRTTHSEGLLVVDSCWGSWECHVLWWCNL